MVAKTKQQQRKFKDKSAICFSACILMIYLNFEISIKKYYYLLSYDKKKTSHRKFLQKVVGHNACLSQLVKNADV